MWKVIAGAVALAVSMAGCALPDCPQEDSTWCYWNARERGNGMGRSYIVFDEGQVLYLD